MKEQQKLDVNLTDDVAQGVYSNLAIITHSNAEFILDFVAMMPGIPKANVRSRVVMTPQNTKRFLNALAENIKKYEEVNGIIKETAFEIPIIGNNGALA
ncbi:MAG: DUF3467 domain-containing protein [Bacteroidales bacterium]|jgi:hypothetical protein|nr:DUF3467 domain-containing protein [Bacteroidales bacterium]